MSKYSSEKMLRVFIREAVEDMFVMDRAQNVTRLSRDSVDDQIDSMILKFEKESITDEEDELLEAIFETKSLKALITEQEDDDEEPEADEPAGSEDVQVDEPAEATLKPKLNVDIFSKKVARLALNSSTLLDPATVIVNRAINFLSKNYDQAHVDRMVDILNTQFDFNLGKERDTNDRAVAVGAFGGTEGGAAPAGG
tara:strand:+ start:93 stop:683 length:591 start_codon:yes stop_codon:yes gene_type:complete